MDNEVEKKTEGVKAWIVRVRRGEAEDLRKRISESARLSGSDVLVIKGNLAFGADHLTSALYHARKAIAEGRNASDSVAMETLLYSSGERQLSSAIKKMSVDNKTESVAVFNISGPGFRPGQGWIEMPRALSSPDAADLAEFGISDMEIKTVPRERVADLVMERVAAVDVLKK